jgi:CxxC-x17-CxxC domain-containing protein
MFKKSYGGGGDWKDKKSFTKKPFDNSMHSATCSGCGNECQVPFKPNGKKPVFCSACYIREEKPEGRSEGRGDKSSFYDKKPAYQSRPHARPDSQSSLNGITTEQYKTLNAKLDAIMKMLRGDERV